MSLFPNAMRCCLLILGVWALAAEKPVGNLTVVQPWVRATVSAAQSAAVYLEIRNGGTAADALLSVSAPGFASRVELHSHEHDQGVMKMRQIEKVGIPAKGRAAFEPGGYHIMLFGLKQQLKEGQKLPLILRFKRAGDQKIEANVVSLTATMGVGMSH